MAYTTGYFETRYIANEDYTLLPNFTQDNVHLNEPFKFGCLNCNITNITWKVEGHDINEKTPTHTYKSPGYKAISVVATLFGNRKVAAEFEIMICGSSKKIKRVNYRGQTYWR